MYYVTNIKIRKLLIFTYVFLFIGISTAFYFIARQMPPNLIIYTSLSVILLNTLFCIDIVNLLRKKQHFAGNQANGWQRGQGWKSIIYGWFSFIKKKVKIKRIIKKSLKWLDDNINIFNITIELDEPFPEYDIKKVADPYNEEDWEEKDYETIEDKLKAEDPERYYTYRHRYRFDDGWVPPAPRPVVNIHRNWDYDDEY